MTHPYHQSKSVAKVTAYRNGDIYFPGKKIVINRRQLRDIDALFREFGYRTKCYSFVRRVCTPHGKHTISAFDDFEDGGSYVVVGNGRFQKLDYGKLAPIKHRRFLKLGEPTKRNKFINITGRIEHVTKTELYALRIIYIHRNGDDRFFPKRLLLKKGMMDDMEQVLKWIQKRMTFITNVSGLYSLEGKQIVDIDEIENATTYVAVERGQKFKNVAYLTPNSSFGTFQRNRPSQLPPINRKAIDQKRGKKVRFIYTSDSNESSFYAYDKLKDKSGDDVNAYNSNQHRESFSAESIRSSGDENESILRKYPGRFCKKLRHGIHGIYEVILEVKPYSIEEEKIPTILEEPENNDEDKDKYPETTGDSEEKKYSKRNADENVTKKQN